MKSLIFAARLLRLLAVGTLSLPLLITAVNAQAPTGSVSGRIFDQATGRSLQGAVVRITGTNASDFTAVAYLRRYPVIARGQYPLILHQDRSDPAP